MRGVRSVDDEEEDLIGSQTQLLAKIKRARSVFKRPVVKPLAFL